MNPRSNFAWSLRRELWENRSVYVAPLVVAAVAVFGFVMSLGRYSGHLRNIDAVDAAKQMGLLVMPFSLAASAVLLTGVVVGILFCAEALHGERRDRSILFWKSMPVSDATTVLAKAAVPLAVLPMVAFTIAVAMQAAMLAVSTAILAAQGLDAMLIVSRVPWGEATACMLYGVVVHALWYAPIYGWLLLVGSWARRAPLLWALLPFFAAFVIETLAFGTGHVAALVKYRVTGAMSEAFVVTGKQPLVHLSQLDPVRFAASPGLWLGLLFAAACIAAAIHQRRRREPI